MTISISFNVPGVSFDVKELGKQIQKINESLDTAKIFDDLQYSYCLEIQSSDPNNELTTILRTYRIAFMAEITKIASIIAEIKADPNNNHLNDELTYASKHMRELIGWLEEEVLHRKSVISVIASPDTSSPEKAKESFSKFFDIDAIRRNVSKIEESSIAVGLSREDMHEILESYRAVDNVTKTMQDLNRELDETKYNIRISADNSAYDATQMTIMN
jgi:hypothetical protein